MRPDNTGLKIALVGWLGIAVSIVSFLTVSGDIRAVFYRTIIPLLLSLLFIFTKRATYGLLFLVLLVFSRWSTILHGVLWKKSALIAVIIAFVYAIVLAVLIKKPENK